MDKRWTGRTCLGLIILVLLTAIGQNGLAQGTIEQGRAQGYLRLGFANEAPFSCATGEGKLAGVDVEILNALLKEIGIPEMQGGLTTFGSLIPGLRARRFDIVASGIYIRPDRCKQVAFGEPLYVVGDAIIVRAGNPRHIHGYADVAHDRSIHIGYPTGGTGVSGNAKAMGVADDQLIGFPDGPTGFAAVKAGRIDGYATTAIVGEEQLRAARDPALERAAPFEQPVVDGKVQVGVTSFALRPEDKDLLAELNRHLAALKATPAYLEILERNGLPRVELPGDWTTARACAG
ncbi:MAG: ectoine/hydroxyectoine ABC transporter substrate-binding protein EhuB [Acetobacteraceae bacterium]|nr:ectoine/hydroxyectoine ABC transporter substrate-binding protein EhuB [Acetobacteraceae bacterium]